jgi:hypothetical protein
MRRVDPRLLVAGLGVVLALGIAVGFLVGGGL